MGGTFESYFSDHKPIFCMLSEESIIVKNQSSQSKEIPPMSPVIVPKIENTDKHDESKKSGTQERNAPNSQPQNEADLNDVIVVPSGPITSPATLTRLREDSLRRSLVLCCRHIRKPYSYLKDIHVDKFIDLANRKLHSKMTTTLAVQSIEYYQPEPGQHLIDDVQILYVGQLDATFHRKIQSIGHYICVHYKVTEGMYRYFPMNRHSMKQNNY